MKEASLAFKTLAEARVIFKEADKFHIAEYESYESDASSQDSSDHQPADNYLDIVHDIMARIVDRPHIPVPISSIHVLAKEFGIQEEQVDDALRIWASVGIMCVEDDKVQFIVDPA